MTGRPERRRLDRAFEANWAHENGGFVVRAGDTKVYVADLWGALIITGAHNGARRDAEYARSLRASERSAVAA